MALPRSLVSLCILFLTVIALATSAKAMAPACEALFTSDEIARPTFHLYSASQTLSQVVRDNADDYWFWSKNNAPKYFTGKMLETEGLVVGDTHPGNFILGPLDGKIRFYLADLKDAGEGPLLLDLARLAMSTQAIYRRVDERPKFPVTLETLLDSYIAGLNQKQQDPPEKLVDLFNTSLTEYQNGLEKDYVDRKTAYKRFRLKNGKIAPFTPHETAMSAEALEVAKADMAKEIHRVRADADIVDFAVRPRDRGGSKEADRYWALSLVGSKEEIVEFKEIDVPAVAFYHSQEPVLKRYEELMAVYWGVKDPTIQPVSIGGRLFWMRPKKVELFSVPYNPETEKRQDKLLDIASYDANYLGQKHGVQMTSKAYLKFVESHREDILEALCTFSKAYLDRTEQRMESRP